MKLAIADPRYRVICARIEPVSGANVYVTDNLYDLILGGNTYVSMSGYQFTGYSATADFSPSSIDIEGIAGVAGVSRARLASGAFDGARFKIFATNWVAPVEDEDRITMGIFGKVTLMDDRYRVEGVSLADVFGQSVGKTYGASCPKKFCGTEYAGCGLSLAANTVTGTLTGVTSASIFTDAGRGEAEDTFGAGTIEFTTGLNAGTRAIEIGAYVSGTIQTLDSFYYLPAIGDQYSMVRGCRKRLVDCQNRLGGSNVINFGGDLWIPSGSTYAHVGAVG